MKKWLRLLLGKQQEGKISEKAFTARITAGIVVILVCMAAMGFSAYAYFTNDITSGTQIIAGASYRLEVEPPSGLAAGQSSYVLDNTEGTAAKSFAFTVKADAANTAQVGYCKINVLTNTGTLQSFYTKPIWNTEDLQTGKVKQRTVTVYVAAGCDAKVYFVAEWGSCTKTEIQDGIVQPAYTPVSTLNEEATEPTTPEPTTPEPTTPELTTPELTTPEPTTPEPTTPEPTTPEPTTPEPTTPETTTPEPTTPEGTTSEETEETEEETTIDE